MDRIGELRRWTGLEHECSGIADLLQALEGLNPLDLPLKRRLMAPALFKVVQMNMVQPVTNTMKYFRRLPGNRHGVLPRGVPLMVTSGGLMLQ